MNFKFWSVFTLVAFYLCGNFITINAQIYLGEKSSSYYNNKIQEVKNRKSDIKYNQKKQQAWYKEYVDGRNKAVLEEFENDWIVYDTILLNKCNNIIERLKKSNVADFSKLNLYINRSMSPNAVCYGDNTLMINLGLFLWIDNDDELALVIAHEIAHQFLKHFESRISKNVDILTSEAFNEELKDIKRSKEGKYDRLKSLLKDFTFETSKHSTYKESEADSLAVVFSKNAGYQIKNAANILLKLDKVDDIFVEDNLYSLQQYIDFSKLSKNYLEKKKAYKGLSYTAVTMNADSAFNNAKTHPDCTERFHKIVKDSIVLECCKQFNNNFKSIKQQALFEIVANTFAKKNYTGCIHFCILGLQAGYNSNYLNAMFSAAISGILLADKKFERFHTVEIGAPPKSTLKTLQDCLMEMSAADLEKLAGILLDKVINKASEDYSFAETNYRIASKNLDPTVEYKQFKNKFSTSSYNNLIPF